MGVKSLTVDNPLFGDIENLAERKIVLTVNEFTDLLPTVGHFVESYGFGEVLSGIKRQLVEGLIMSRWTQRQNRFVNPYEHIKCYASALGYLRRPDIKLPYSVVQALTLELKYGIKEENFAWRYGSVMETYKDDSVSEEEEREIRKTGNVMLVGAFAPVEITGIYNQVGVWMRERVKNEASGQMWYSIPGGKASLEDIKTGEITAIRELDEETKLKIGDFVRNRIRLMGIVDEVMINSKGERIRYLGYLATGILFVDKTIFGDELEKLKQNEIDELIRIGKLEYARKPKPQNGDGNGEWEFIEPFILRNKGLSPLRELEFAPITRLFMRNYRK